MWAQNGVYIASIVKWAVVCRRFIVIGKTVATAITLVLAFGAFWWDAMGAGHILDPFGILSLLLAAITWIKWDLVRDAFTRANPWVVGVPSSTIQRPQDRMSVVPREGDDIRPLPHASNQLFPPTTSVGPACRSC